MHTFRFECICKTVFTTFSSCVNAIINQFYSKCHSTTCNMKCHSLSWPRVTQDFESSLVDEERLLCSDINATGNSPPLWRKTSRGDAVKRFLCLPLTHTRLGAKQKTCFINARQIHSKPQRSGMLWICGAYDEEREGWQGIWASRTLTTLLSLRLLTCFSLFLAPMAVRSL